MSAEVVFAAYRPRSGKGRELEKLVASHVPTLRKLGLATKREPIIVRAKDGTIVEIFEWVSNKAAHDAHEHPAVARIWEAMGKVADFVPLGALTESKRPFTHYKPMTF